MKEYKIKLVIGFITYGKSTARYLPYFLSSLKAQTYQDYKVVVIDNSERKENENVSYINKNFPNIELTWAGGNIGFAKAYNKMISSCVKTGVQYFMVINPDIILEPDAIAKLVKALDNDNKLGSVCPKILRWDFKNNKKTNIIDSCGIKLKPGLNFIDIGQGQVDQGQYNNIKIIGPSGAAGMYRLRALAKVKEGDNYFDELMFMYKEDCDLVYRLYLAGYKSRCVSEAIIYHDRTAAAKGESDWQVALNRKRKDRKVKVWSFLNQQIIFAKYWNLQRFRLKLAIILYQIKILIFILLFEQYLLGQLIELWKIRKKIKIYQ